MNRRLSKYLYYVAAIAIALALTLGLTIGSREGFGCAETATTTTQTPTAEALRVIQQLTQTATEGSTVSPSSTAAVATSASAATTTTTSQTDVQSPSDELTGGPWLINFVDKSGAVVQKSGVYTFKDDKFVTDTGYGGEYDVAEDGGTVGVTITLIGVSQLDGKPIHTTFYCTLENGVLEGWVEAEVVNKTGNQGEIIERDVRKLDVNVVGKRL